MAEHQQSLAQEGDQDSDLGIRPFAAEFRDTQTELAFREVEAQTANHRLYVALLFGAVLTPVSTIPDLLANGWSTPIMVVLIIQLTFTVGALLLAAVLHRHPSEPIVPIQITALESWAVLITLVIMYLQPERIPTIQLFICSLLMVALTFIPNRFLYALAVSTAALVGVVAMSFAMAPRFDRQLIGSAVALVTITGLAVITGNALARSRRSAHRSLIEEQRANERLVEEISMRQALQSELKWLADHDALTNVLNRRAFLERAEEVLELAKRSGVPISVMLIDGDNFKELNDTYGHHIGDEAIRTITRMCSASIRSNDLLGRYGGEEFAIVMPEAPRLVAERAAAHMRERVSRHEIHHPDGPITFTISIGLVECLPDVHHSISQLIQYADDAMYRAKVTGRNRVVTAP